MEKKIVVPLDERPLNKVDKFLAEIKSIQSACEHDFRLLKEPILRESLVRCVYIGEKADEREITSTFDFVCLKCSKSHSTTILKTCPRCLGEMKKEEFLANIDGSHLWARIHYFGSDYLYYAVRLSRCSTCGFTIACDEWDQ